MSNYYTSDNRVHSSFEAARAHCIANPKVAMSRSAPGQRFAKSVVNASSTPSPSAATYEERIAKLEAQVASLLAAKPAKRATKAAKPITFTELPVDDQPF